jgi:small nuclear ribonucleoprotein (snRNP)-like protein
VSRYYILLGLTTDHRQLPNDVYEEFDNTKRVTINRKKDRQYNGTKERDKMTNTHLQNTT